MLHNLMNLKTLTMASLALLTVLLASSESKADITGFCNPDSFGQCSATVSLSGNILTVTLTNTSLSAGSLITAAAFNFTAGTTIVGGSFTQTDPGNDFVFTQGSISVSPDGERNAMFSATNNPSPSYLGGGSPNGGTAIGSTVVFTVTLSSLNGNTEEAIFNSMLIRFRGGPDSDKDELTAVPEPASMLLLGSGLIGVAVGIRRRRQSE